ncbi:N-acetylmuramoyl-L-alanine amidase-like domain-containing protein [Geofilum rhodophaeum]|uniref:N-acetylmuramoyl-L-alanine amidase-like domain-containing protein n=1 Tax=Geofilum rhodophaeum TaxID=1965019 RepID=UPI001F0B3810|nr:N-acetylmuramoyl-L-alanine amidase-like domain-containing protein [Geofilum rhodophaeum]
MGPSLKRQNSFSPWELTGAARLEFWGGVLLVLALTAGFVYAALSVTDTGRVRAALPTGAAASAGEERPLEQGAGVFDGGHPADSVWDNYGTGLIALGETFIGTPYVGATLESEGEEQVVVNLEEMDCTTFVEYVLALAAAGVQPDELPQWRTYFEAERKAVSGACPHGAVYSDKLAVEDKARTVSREAEPEAERRLIFLEELEGYRYRGGTCEGYLSRLHYFSEWLLDNEQRGRLQILRDLPGAEALQIDLHFMSTHPHLYPQLDRDSTLVNRLRTLELAQRGQQLSYLPNAHIAAAEQHLQEGDILAFVSRVKGLDVSHTGLATFREGRLHLLHASTRNNQVEISPVPLSDYVKGMSGVRGILAARPLPPKKWCSAVVLTK